MVEYSIVPATKEHAAELSYVMRAADRMEIWAATRKTPEEALLESMKLTPEPLVGLVDGRVICMFGIAQPSLMSNIGFPWMLGSEEITRHRIRFLRESKKWVQQAHQKYRLLRNYVDARYLPAIRWVKWLGFEVLPAVPIGPDNTLFHEFRMER